MNMNTLFRLNPFKLLLLTLMLGFLSMNSYAFEDCPAPSNFQVSIQGNSALLTWDPAPGVTSYEVGYFNQNDGSSATAITGGTSYTFNNLPMGVYQFWVRSLCEDGTWSQFIIEVEEIDAGLMEDIYNCLCDTFYYMEVESVDYKAVVDWNTEDDPCFTQYRLDMAITKHDGGLVSVSTMFTYDPGEIEELINSCVQENIPLIQMPDDGPTRTYISRDVDDEELYRLEFEEESFSVTWNPAKVESYTFDFSNCVFCPDEDGASTSSEPQGAASAVTNLMPVKIWPNPFSDVLKIQWTQAAGSLADIKVYNTSGILISREETVSEAEAVDQFLRLDTGAWPLGIYFIVVDTGKDIVKLRHVKIK